MITNKQLAVLLRVLIAVILIIMLWATISSSGENKRLKKAVKSNLEYIERLESEKIAIFESLKKDSLKIIEKDSIILELSKEEFSLNNKLKHLKNEKFVIKNAYLRNDATERVRIFAKLATETDSVR